MKTITITAVLTVSLLLAGCGKKAGPPGSNASAAAPIAQPCMTAWQQGDKAAAISAFVETEWSSGPLFAADSTLSLTEDQYKALSNADRQAKSGEMMPQLDSLKKLAAAVAQAGRDAASKGDTAQARKYFTSLKQCGTALDNADRLRMVQLVGQALKKMADAELARVGQ
jgi:major membrane immunogen (membrane-anchored lipoprotein)